jgi:hypothetical protein
VGDLGLVLVVGAVVAIGFVLWSRMNEIFCISIRGGRTLVVRGAVPPSLLHGIADVVSRERVVRGSVRAVKGATHARLVTSGIDDGTTQRLRNVFGTHSVQKLRSAGVPGPKNVGQWLGIAWLAWLFVGRSR